MIKKRYVVLALGIVSVFLASLFVGNVILAQSSGEYDPWIDYNEDGIVDVNDLHSLGQVYSSSGDPTKYVNIENWPISRAVTVWYSLRLEGGSTPNFSPVYNASGFGHLHILAHGAYVSGTLRLYLRSLIYTPAHTLPYMVAVDSFDITSTTPYFSVTIPVPSEEFYFMIEALGAGSGDFFLSFYLTWS